jgi:hypothetical protein
VAGDKLKFVKLCVKSKYASSSPGFELKKPTCACRIAVVDSVILRQAPKKEKI